MIEGLPFDEAKAQKLMQFNRVGCHSCSPCGALQGHRTQLVITLTILRLMNKEVLRNNESEPVSELRVNNSPAAQCP